MSSSYTPGVETAKPLAQDQDLALGSFHNQVLERVHKILATTPGIKEASPSYIDAPQAQEMVDAAIAPITVYHHGMHPLVYPYPWAYIDFQADRQKRKSPTNFIHESDYIIMFHARSAEPIRANTDVHYYARLAGNALWKNDLLEDPSNLNTGTALVKEIKSMRLTKFPIGIKQGDNLVVACGVYFTTMWVE